MKELQKCPLCQAQLVTGIIVKDHFGSKEDFELKHCKKCDTLITSPQPKQSEIGKYYKANQYVSHGDSKGYIFDSIYQFIQHRNHNYKLRLIQKYSLGQHLLDFGAGAGSLAKFYQSKGFDVTAIEPDKDARAQIPRTINYHPSLEEVKQQQDIITSYHVLEHVHDLDRTLDQFKTLLKRNGTIHIALPNYKSLDAQYYQAYWAGYDVPRHLYHFSQKSVHSLIKKHGLNLLGTHPLNFDSYYVSLLSEQYKNSKFAGIKAALKGFQSNYSAKKTGEYSSLIYVITN